MNENSANSNSTPPVSVEHSVDDARRHHVVISVTLTEKQWLEALESEGIPVDAPESEILETLREMFADGLEGVP